MRNQFETKVESTKIDYWSKIDASVKPARYYTPSGFGLVSYTDYVILEKKLQEAEELIRQLKQIAPPSGGVLGEVEGVLDEVIEELKIFASKTEEELQKNKLAVEAEEPTLESINYFGLPAQFKK